MLKMLVNTVAWPTISILILALFALWLCRVFSRNITVDVLPRIPNGNMLGNLCLLIMACVQSTVGSPLLDNSVGTNRSVPIFKSSYEVINRTEVPVILNWAPTLPPTSQPLFINKRNSLRNSRRDRYLMCTLVGGLIGMALIMSIPQCVYDRLCPSPSVLAARRLASISTGKYNAALSN